MIPLRLRILGTVTFYALAALYDGGCSGTKEIAAAINTVRQDVAEIERDNLILRQTIEDKDAIARPSLPPNVLIEYDKAGIPALAALNDIAVRCASIVKASDEVTKALTTVHDNEPQWMKALKLIAAIIGGLAVIYVIFKFGNIIRAWLGLVTPKTNRTAIEYADVLEAPDANASEVKHVLSRVHRDPVLKVRVDQERKKRQKAQLQETK